MASANRSRTRGHDGADALLRNYTRRGGTASQRLAQSRRGRAALTQFHNIPRRPRRARFRLLAGKLIQTHETARARIARHLHDEVCQELAGVSLTLSRLKDSSASLQDPRTQEVLSRIQTEMLAIYDDVHRLSQDLYPETLGPLGLATSLRAHCAQFEKRHGVYVTFSTTGDLGRLHPDVAVAIFRSVEECLRNGIVHGSARNFVVAVTRDGDTIELTVSDDGRGFDVDAVRRRTSGLGLLTLEQRAYLLDGRVRIASERGRGTAVRLRCPARAADDPPDSRPPAAAASFDRQPLQLTARPADAGTVKIS
jgi:signal transduction histidine kinase